VKFFNGRQGRKNKKPIPFRQIVPNMVTSGNLLCGMFSLMFVFHGLFMPAAWMIFFAVIFDGLDGKVARSLGGGSQFGMEYDSLADLVSFGVAPGMMVYVAALKGFGGILGAMVACFFALCVALRLARFNVMHVPGLFQGLPSPAGGLFVASFILADVSVNTNPVIMSSILFLTSLLMISSIPYANLKKLNRKTANKKRCFVLLGLVSLCLIVLRSVSPLVLLSLYIISGLLRLDWGEWLLQKTVEEEIH